MSKKSNIMLKDAILWIVSIFMLLSALVYFPSFASIFMLLSCISLLPLPIIKKYYHRIIPQKAIRICIAIVLIILCIVLVPENNTNNDINNNDNDSEITDTTDPESEIESDSESEPEQEESESEESETDTDTESDIEPDSNIESDNNSEKEPESKDSESEIGSEEDSVKPESDVESETESETETEPIPVDPVKSTFNIHFIDVGQADAALVECDGHYMLIDGGNKSDSSLIYTLLKNTKVPKLDIVVGTHAHEDHIGGVPGALNYATADLILCPVTEYDTDAFNDFKKYAVLKAGGITVPHVGDKYSLGSASIEIVGVNSTPDANCFSIVLMITYGNTKFLFTGDAEREAEQVILSYGKNLFADVLKVGHHGSNDSTTYPFLRDIMPKYAVISVGEDNPYGHPAEDTLSRLRDADVKVYRTDMQGDIYCTSDGEEVTFFVERNADANTLTNPVKVVEPSEPESSPADIPVGTDYVLNTNTKKFHYPSCNSVKKMGEKNKSFFTGTRDELLNMGYDPCGNCKP